MKKPKAIEGHAYMGGANGHHFCECGHGFFARTAAACRRLHAVHVAEIPMKRFAERVKKSAVEVADMIESLSQAIVDAHDTHIYSNDDIHPSDCFYCGITKGADELLELLAKP